MEIGTETIQHYVKTLGHQPGVYRMLDENGQVLYVGKARDLKNRVSNYTSLAGKNNRLAKMIMQVASMEFVTTRSEAEALLLEANLIKKLEPRYNILLRDGKSFPYLHISQHRFARIHKYRGNKDSKGDYFGPFASAGDVDKTLLQLQKAFLLRPCTDNMFNSRNRPCLQYQIKRCSAPCVDYISEQDYADTLKQAKQFLTGQSSEVQDKLLQEMKVASEKKQYEQAAILRDRLRALSQIQREQGIYLPKIGNVDIVSIIKKNGMACVQVFFFRNGQNFGNQPHFISCNEEQTEADILSAFLPQFYNKQPPPKTILLSHKLENTELMQEALAVKISTPQRGDKLDAVKQATQNAKQALQQYLQTRINNSKLIEKLAEIFELETIPTRIEVYDNSHISGSHSVGAMIVAGAEGFIKKHYRKFNIKQASGDDDFAMMREVLERRLKRLVKSEVKEQEVRQEGRTSHEPAKQRSIENSEEFSGNNNILLLIDGGKGQLSAIKQVMEELGIWGDVPIVAISKGVDRNAGREKFHLPNKPEFQLPINDPVLHYLQRLRDEAHRYAIGTHRNKRSSALKKSELDNIAGIGAKRKKALLQHFGSARAVSNASAQDIAKVDGISDKIAKTIWQQFHS